MAGYEKCVLLLALMSISVSSRALFEDDIESENVLRAQGDIPAEAISEYQPWAPSERVYRDVNDDFIHELPVDDFATKEPASVFSTTEQSTVADQTETPYQVPETEDETRAVTPLPSSRSIANSPELQLEDVIEVGGACPKINGLYPVFLSSPTDPTIFFICNWGTAFEFKCPTGLFFNPKISVCDWPYNVDI